MFKNNVKIDCDYTYVENPLVVLKGVSQSFHGQEIFNGVDLVINNDDRIAIVGPNGIGKSSLLKIILGFEKSDEGLVERNKDLRIGYLPQETHWKSLDREILEEMKSADTEIYKMIVKKREYEILLADKKRKDLKRKIAEYGVVAHKYEALKGYEYERQAEEQLGKFNFSAADFNRKVRSLSGGERTRLALAKIILQKPNILILDEPTNHLDLETIIWLENFLRDWHMALILVSHDHQFLDLVCDKTYELSKHGIEKYFCKYSEYIEEKEKKLKLQEAAVLRQEKYFQQQEAFIERFRYKATKAKAVQSRIKLLDKMERIKDSNLALAKKKMKIKFGSVEGLPNKVLEIKNLVVGQKDIPLAIMEGEWEVEKKDKIGIVGANGAGKSTLLKALSGKTELMEGKISYAGKIKTGYYAQAHEDLDPNKNILDEARGKSNLSDGKIRSILGCLLFTGDDAEKMVSDLSGGERARLAIVELILNNSNMLLLDEPTNHLDLASKEAMAEVLKNFSGPIIMVSHDRYVLNKVCNFIWEIKDGEVRKYVGNYDDYKNKKIKI